MASDLDFVEFVADQIENAGVIAYRKMFGEYALYCEGKVVALICDTQLFVKPTKAGKSFIGNVVEAPPYPGAKPSFLIEEQIEDRDWISNLIRLTENELPPPKVKKKSKKKRGKKTELLVSSRQEWRSWLKKNHAKAKEIWLVYLKKSTGMPSINYTDSVEEALCFGWIDGIKKSIDEQKYVHRFTPRKSASKWSPRNIRLAEKMIEDGWMTQAGLVVFNQRLIYDEKNLKARDAKEIPLTSEIEKALRANKKAWDNFTNLAPGYKKQYANWLRNAKKQETLERRIKEAIKLLAANKKLGMK